VCGWCNFPDGIAVNIAQLKLLVCKCKSSISGSLKGMGYDIVLSRPSLCQQLLIQIPYLKDHPVELRQWTVRLCSGTQFASCLGTGSRPSGPNPRPHPRRLNSAPSRRWIEDEITGTEFPGFFDP
jgi:hypothetical protein